MTAGEGSNLRERIASALRVALPPREASALEIVESARCDGFARHLVRFTSEEDRVPAYLAIPDGRGPFPAMLVLHQHNGERHLGKSEVFGLVGDRWQAFGPSLAKAGWVVLAPDSIAFEDRRYGVDGVEPDRADWEQHYNELAYRLIRGDTLARTVVSDAAMAISVLAALEEVDPARIGALGHSYGGNTVLFLAAVDERVKFAVASGAACTYRRKMADRTGIEMAEVIPGVVGRFDIEDLVRSVAPRPLLLVSADADRYSADASDIVRAALPAYEAYSSSGNLRHIRFGGGHALDATRFAAISDWVASQS